MDSIDPVALAQWTSGEWKNGIPSSVTGIHNDSRKLEKGQLFIALRSSARDGHDFLDAAKSSGASGAIVESFQGTIDFPQLLVDDVPKAIIDAARGYRSTWTARVVGITGSCGKTTCKEVLASLLSSRKTLSTQGNLNNLIGVPMSILRPVAKEAEFAVLEAGISEPGEMEQLATAIMPEFGIVTAIGPSHLEDLKTVENVAVEKGKLLRGRQFSHAFVGETAIPYLNELECENAVVVKCDSSFESEWTYEFKSSAGRTDFQQRVEGKIQNFEYAGSGAGLASNVALAVATAVSLGLSVEEIAAALSVWAPSQMRNEWREFCGNQIFLDCYNANPISMQDSLSTFVAETPEERPRFYLVGCMEELGKESARLHADLGRDFPLRKQDFLLVIGSEAKSVLQGMKDAGNETEKCFEIGSIEEAKDRLARFSGSVFLKGSRRYRLESALEYLKGGVSC